MNLIQRQIKTAIDSLYSSDTTGFKSSINGLYYYKVPDGITQFDYPIVVYSIIHTEFEYTFDKGFIPKQENMLVDFHILSNPSNGASTEAENILNNLEAVYDGGSLPLSGWTLVEMSRDSITGPYRDEDDIWNLGVKYRVVCERN